MYTSIETRARMRINKYLREGEATKNYSNILAMLVRLRQVIPCHLTSLILALYPPISDCGAYPPVLDGGWNLWFRQKFHRQSHCPHQNDLTNHRGTRGRLDRMHHLSRRPHNARYDYLSSRLLLRMYQRRLRHAWCQGGSSRGRGRRGRSFGRIHCMSRLST